MSDEWSMGEVGRRIEALSREVTELAARVDTKYVRFDLFEASKQIAETERSAMNARMEQMESRNEWLVRTVIGIIITAVVGTAIAYSKAKTGG